MNHLLNLNYKICLLLLSTLLLLPACQKAGTLTYELHTVPLDGGPQQSHKLVIKTPPNATHPGSLEIGVDGTVRASTGAAPSVSAASKSLGKLPWLGGLLLVAGVVAFALRLKLPFLPIELGIGLAGSGLLLMILPSIIEAYLPFILLGLIASAAIITIYRLNKTTLRLRQLDPKDKTPNPDSDPSPPEI